MSKSSLRRIAVDGQQYRWRLHIGYRRIEPTANGQLYTATYELTIYAAGRRQSPARVRFETWECAVIGGPLHTAAPLDLDRPLHVPSDEELSSSRVVHVNLHHPRAVAHVIRQLAPHGWRPESTRQPYVIDDGWPFLAGLGADA